MTRPTDAPRPPGTTLLKIAPLLFNDQFMALVVLPTIADLQSEVAAAGPHGVRRLRARWRGYSAFWTLLLFAPFASWSEQTPNLGPSRLGFASAIAALAAASMLGTWIVAVVAAGALVACLLHAWYERHPTDVSARSEAAWHSPQINFSSTDVGGNIGGLIFVIGSVLIVSLGVPFVFWFLFAGTIAACFVAWGLAAWHTRARGKAWTCTGRPRRQLV
jgi:hypothetical protein